MAEPRFNMGDRIMFVTPSKTHWAADTELPLGAMGTIIEVDESDSSYNVHWELPTAHRREFWIAWSSAGEAHLPNLTDPMEVEKWLTT